MPAGTLADVGERGIAVLHFVDRDPAQQVADGGQVVVRIVGVFPARLPDDAPDLGMIGDVLRESLTDDELNRLVQC